MSSRLNFSLCALCNKGLWLAMVSGRNASLPSSGPALRLLSAVHFASRALTSVEFSPCCSVRLNVLIVPLEIVKIEQTVFYRQLLSH